MSQIVGQIFAVEKSARLLYLLVRVNP